MHTYQEFRYILRIAVGGVGKLIEIKVRNPMIKTKANMVFL